MSMFKKPSELAYNSTIKALVYGQPGLGKAQPNFCHVLTPSGYKTLGEIEVGDTVMGQDGKTQMVLGVYPQGMRPVYKITTNDGAVTYCDEEHIWNVRFCWGNSRKAGFRNMTLKQMLEKGILCPNSESRKQSGRKAMARFEIPVSEPMQFTEKNFEIEPYILGVLIGDGSLTGNVALFSNPLFDSQIRDKVEQLLPPDYKLVLSDAPSCPQYRITLKGDGDGEGYIQRVKRLGLNVTSHDKFIPRDYLFGSVQQRLELLRGLMDTDGCAVKNKVCLSTTSKRLASDMVELVNSLGGIAVIHIYSQEDKGDEYRVVVRMNECPFSLDRKAQQWNKPTQWVSRYIVDATRVEDSECTCIKVSNDDELFITDNYIVTHNTTVGLSAPNPVLFDFDGGVQRVNGAFQCPTLQVQNWDEVLQALKELETEGSEFKTIVIDTAGKMLDFMSAYIIKQDSRMGMRDGSLSLKGYGARKMMFINFLKRVSMMGKHVIFVAHEREEKDGDLRIVRPEIGGSSQGDLIKELDLVGYMQAIGNKRTISWTPQEKFYAKNTCNLPPMQEIPCIIDAQGKITGRNNFMSVIFENYNAYLKEESSLRKEYDSLITEIEDEVSCISDAEQANAYVLAMKDKKQIWDSNAHAKSLITDRCKELGLKFNNTTKKYEEA